MFKIYLITYNLNTPGKDYEPLFDAIKTSGTSGWWHYLKSSWLIKSSETADMIRERLKRVLDTNDHVLIVEINKNNKQGRLPKKARNWINNK